jgi:hypothetical protein
MTVHRRSVLAAALIALVLSGTGFVSVAASQTLTYGAAADAYVMQTAPSKNFGNRRDLLVAGGSAAQESFVRFNVTGLTGTVVSARVRLMVSDGSSDGPAIHATSSSWVEGSITWNNRPGPGAQLDDRGPVASNAWAEWNVTGAITSNGAYSFVLRGGAAADGINGESSETRTPPQLVVVTEGGTPTPTPTPVPTPVPTPTPTPVPTPTATPIPTPTPTPVPTPTPTPVPTPTPTPTPIPTPTPTPTASPPGDPVLVAAGDIADCVNQTGVPGVAQTGNLLDTLPGTIVTLGDTTYPNGLLSEFTGCYDPHWGEHKARTKPVPGNHDYGSLDTGTTAAGYFTYFGAAAGDPAKGYYSYDLANNWHVVALNSQCLAVGGCHIGSPQATWLANDLAANAGKHVVAYWHHPRFSSGQHGNDSKTQAFWDLLYEHGAEIVLVGHDHNYERFAPQDPFGTLDAQYGIRQFVVGTGGVALKPMSATAANSQISNSTDWGVLKLTLGASGYSWAFVPVAGKTFTDSGSGAVHGPPPEPPPPPPTVSSAADTFSRTVSAGGLGTAETGGAWTVGEGNTVDYSVDGSKARLNVTAANQSRNAELQQVSVRDFSATVVAGTTSTVTASPHVLWAIEGRRSNNSNYYVGRFRANATGTIDVGAQRVVGGIFTNLGGGWVSVPRETWVDGVTYNLKVEMTGSGTTTIRVKVWRVGTAEPAAWDFQATDSTATLQAAGRVGMRGYVYSGASSRVTTFDDYFVTNLTTAASSPTGVGQESTTAAHPATFRYAIVAG